jgi:hypothetical protein
MEQLQEGEVAVGLGATGEGLEKARAACAHDRGLKVDRIKLHR